MTNILSIITFLPLVSALILAVFLRGDDAAANRNAKWLALIATTATFLISLFILFRFDPSNTGFQFVSSTYVPPIHSTPCWLVPDRRESYTIIGCTGIPLPVVILLFRR